ncbi:salicylate hydroxylase [Echria macrotheca]|uniref:Salicylate hydroxylase n=1 Tax=Echria macrotheca TaxID=438768 RepID=A0AAJ0FAK1_9PEZI|nr:salicylate hydroxylase [Echria macrotheca]
MKIIIIGAGISGLATYLHLRKHLPSPPSAKPHTIHIYESHSPRTTTETSQSQSFEALSSSTAIVGGGLGVSPNGMRVLRHLSPELHAAVAAQGFPCENFVFMGANGWTLGIQPTSDHGGFEGPDGHAEVCVASSRHGLWACLMDAVGDGVVQYRKVVEIKTIETTGKKTVVFEDGGEEEGYDLVIGADGVRSVVRKAIFGDQFGPVYTGVSGVGGFLRAPLPPRVLDNRAMVFTFGGNGFFGYASGGPPEANSIMWWSSFETDSLPSKETLDIDEIKAEMRKRHGNWGDPVVRDIVATADVESIYPTWVMPDLPHWGEKAIVLVGDAAHALSPTTGQGASQALEDAQTLSLLLAETLKKVYASPENVAEGEKDAVAFSAKHLFSIRASRIKEIADRGRKLDSGKRNVNVAAEYAMYCFLWVMMHVRFIGK